MLEPEEPLLPAPSHLGSRPAVWLSRTEVGAFAGLKGSPRLGEQRGGVRREDHLALQAEMPGNCDAGSQGSNS